MEKVTIPDSLRIDPSKITKDPEPFDCGGYADVYSGRYRGEQVALKRIRSNDINKVSFDERRHIHSNYAQRTSVVRCWRGERCHTNIYCLSLGFILTLRVPLCISYHRSW